jgi:hypothetical protein
VEPFDEYAEEPEEEERPRDPAVDQAKKVLRQFFREYPRRVFYLRQVAVLFERRFFHWITSKALDELATDNEILDENLLQGFVRNAPRMRVFYARGQRDNRRRVRELATLVASFSVPVVSRAIGLHGEMMVDSAMSRAGFVNVAQNTRSFGGRTASSLKDLDRIYACEGLHYGSEIKNKLEYMDLAELKEKIQICHELELVPLFLVRMFPQNYMQMMREAGGGAILFQYQLYPYALEDRAATVRQGLGAASPLRVRPEKPSAQVPTLFPVDAPRTLESGYVERVRKFHAWRVKRPANWRPDPQELARKVAK